MSFHYLNEVIYRYKGGYEVESNSFQIKGKGQEEE